MKKETWHFDSINHEWITGVVLGFEWVEDLFSDTNVNFLVIDLVILRLVFSFYKE